MKKYLVFTFTLLLSTPIFAQMRIKRDTAKAHEVHTLSPSKNSMDIAKDFIYDLADDNIPTYVILSQHVLVKDADDEMYDYLLASMEEIRLNLMSKRVDQIQFIPFTGMSRKEVSDIDPEGKDTNNMFFLQYGKRQVTALYIEEGKVASFTLVSKGNNKAHFVTY